MPYPHFEEKLAAAPTQNFWAAGEDDAVDNDEVRVLSVDHTIIIYSCKESGSDGEGENTAMDDNGIFCTDPICISVSVFFVFDPFITLFRV